MTYQNAPADAQKLVALTRHVAQTEQLSTLTVRQLAVLLELAAVPNGMRPAALARRLGIYPSALSRAIGTMSDEKRPWVVREAMSDDLRGCNLWLSVAGMKAAAEAMRCTEPQDADA